MKHNVLYWATNYLGKPSALRGCVADLQYHTKHLEKNIGIDSMTTIVETDALTDNVKSGMLDIRSKTKAGDVCGIGWSSHGAQVPDSAEADGWMEVICPHDFDWNPKRMITDDWFASWLAGFVPGAKVWTFGDCCHSRDNTRGIGGRCFGVHPDNPIGNAPLRKFLCRSAIAAPSMQVHMSACQSDQTAADAFIRGEARGAFTTMWLDTQVTLGTDMSHNKAMAETALRCRVGKYTQVPAVDGPAAALQSRVYFMEA